MPVPASSPASPDPLADSRRRRRAAALLPALLLWATAACSGDAPRYTVDNVDAELTPTMTSRNVETLISDSGITRYRITAPLWLVYDEAAEPHWRFPQGLELEKYNLLFQREATVRADSARYDRVRQLWRLDGNVNIENTQGEVILTPQLFWDQRDHKVYSDSFVHIERADRTLEGYGFTANEAMTNYRIHRVQGIFPASQFEPGANARAASPADTDTI